MAYLIQKAVTGHCAVLDSRQAIFYPLQLPNWTGLHIGAFISFTSISDTNSQWSAENVSYTNNNNGIFFGIKDSGFYLPGTSGQFIGVATSSGYDSSNSTLTTNQFYGYNQRFAAIGTSGSGTNYLGDLSGFFLSPIGQVTGNSSFAAFWGMRIEIQNYQQTGQMVKILTTNNSGSIGYTNMSASHLSGIAEFFPPTISSTNYQHYTTGFVSDGGPLPIPNTLFFYCPFINNRLRLHSLYAQSYI